MAHRDKIKFGFLLVVVVAISSFTTSIYAGSSEIVLCANVKTGSLRYSKGGSCSKQESRLSINPNGALGPAGPAGPAGANGSNSSVVSVQDATGTIFTYVGGAGCCTGAILWNGLIWSLTSGAFSNNAIPTGIPVFFIDAACLIPIFGESFAEYNGGTFIQATMVTTSDGNATATSRVKKAYKRKGNLIAVNPAKNYYVKNDEYYCEELPGGKNWNGFPTIDHYYETEETTPLVFVPPLKFVVG